MPLWIPVLLGIGIALYFSLKFEPALWVGAFAVCLCVVTALGVRKQPILLMISLVATIIAAGFLAAQIRTLSAEHIRLTERHGPASVIGKIVRVEKFPDSQRVTLDRPRVSDLSPDKTPDRIRLRLRGAQPGMLPGDWISTQAILSPPPAPAAPGAFDFQRHSYFLRLGNQACGDQNTVLPSGLRGSRRGRKPR